MKRNIGKALLILGTAVILVNAAAYLFRWEWKNSYFSLAGIICVVIGASIDKKSQ